MNYYLKLRGIPADILHMADCYSAEKERYDVDFILSTFDLGNTETCRFDIKEYWLIEEFTMPDQSMVYLYKIRGHRG